MKISGVFRASLLAGVCIGLLSGCSWLDDWPPGGESAAKQAMAPPPPIADQRAGEAAAPGKEKKDAKAHKAAEAAPVVPAKPLSTEERIAKLENEMAGMRNDVGMMMPALTKLAEAQGDIKQILANLESNYARGVEPAAGAPMPLTDMPAPATAPVAAKAKAKSPAPQAQPVSYSSAAVSQVRIGEHPGKTRLVLDVTGDANFTYDVDNGEQLLTLSLSGTSWQGQTGMQILNSPVIASYTAAPDGNGGTQMVVQLKKQAQIVWAQKLPASGSNGPRIVVDVAPL